jgi:hypothetical protein
MIILGIDPGTTKSAVAQWDGKRVTAVIKDNEILVKEFQQGFWGGFPVIEMVASYGMPVGKEVFETCVWIGRFIQALERNNPPTLRYTRNEVKMHFCHQTRGVDDGVLIRVLKDRFGEKGTKKNPGLTYGLKADMWQAFAIAVMAYDNLNLNQKEKP